MKNKEEEIASNKDKEVQTLKLNDSILIGYPKISDDKFINNLRNDFWHFSIYENILNSMNKKYMAFEKSEVIKEEIVDDIILKLIKKKIKKSDIHNKKIRI
ncbi:hypothetical protein [Chishuiella sp.]|uniref:hypothetical protein n=1 Tax=Chishuiella sp. TaxID=1969467 RepID=UPI0028AF49BF|nr:hypothetical protein [Chishuiella sp.]